MESEPFKRFDVASILAGSPNELKPVEHPKNTNIFLQGDPADAVLIIQKGRVKLVVVSSTGKRAIVGVLKEGDFFGEECVLGDRVRLTTATAITRCELVRMEKEAVQRMMRKDARFSRYFAEGLISHGIRAQQDLIDRLFNSAETRLARTLLLLAQMIREGKGETVRFKVSQEILSEMIGSNRPRVNQFMNKFKALGLIDYDKTSVEIRISRLKKLLGE